MKLFEIAFDWDSLKQKYTFSEDDNSHKISLSNKSGAVGYIEWDIDDGEVQKIYVGIPYRRLGVGTHLWELATDWANDNDAVAPEHSSKRSRDGDAFAQSIGGHIPDLTDDVDGWSQ